MLLINIKTGLAFKIDQRSVNMSSLWKNLIVAWYHAKASRWNICASASDHDGSGFAVVLSLAREHCDPNSLMVTLLPDLCGIPIISYRRRGGMEILMALRAWYRAMVLKSMLFRVVEGGICTIECEISIAYALHSYHAFCLLGRTRSSNLRISLLVCSAKLKVKIWTTGQ